MRVNFYANSLRNALEKFRHLPYVLARDTGIRALLNGENHPHKVNPHLDDFAHISNTLIFVLDSSGSTVATSNWRTDQDLSGHNFNFRPYFKDAREGRSGGYYAVGFRTRKPGFFISYPVLQKGKFLGVVVVKVSLEDVQKSWQDGGETVIVSDAYGVLFLSSNTDWKYKSLRPLSRNTARLLRDTQYLGLPLTTLDVHRKSIEYGNILQLEGTRYLEQSLQLPDYGWRIHYLTDLKIVSNHVKLAITVSAATTIMLLLIFLYLRERRQKIISRQETRKAHAIKDINARLRREIREHKLTEENLLKTQKELIQAGKLAALGRMSAAIVHELNQPVTAIRTFVASCRIFVERQQPKEILENLEYISRLTERMATITGQLKIFARKGGGKQEYIDLNELIHNVLLIFSPQIKAKGIHLTKELVPSGTAIVLGNQIQLEQVMSNLIHNAFDASKESERKELFLRLNVDNTTATVQCLDRGIGISSKAIDSLFDPFYTSKDIGEGLGLGLSIAYGIIEDMNGTIAAENRKKGGACFSLVLPLIKNETSDPDTDA